MLRHSTGASEMSQPRQNATPEYLEGYNAYIHGEPPEACLYQRSSNPRKEWMEGYNDASEDYDD
jgi:ribosome modulation factor